MAEIENFSEWQNVINSSQVQELQLAAGAEDISTPASLAEWARRNGYKVVQKSDGSIINFSELANGTKEAQALEEIGNAMNSNATGSTANNVVQYTRPLNTTIEKTETGAKITTKAVTGTTKAGGSVAIKAIGTAGAALTGASVGTALGNLITKGLYKVNPDFWGGVNPSTINFKDYFPPVIGDFYNMYFGVDENGNSQMYMQEDDFAAIALALQQLGAFETPIIYTAEIDNSTLIDGEKVPLPASYFVFDHPITFYNDYEYVTDTSIGYDSQLVVTENEAPVYAYFTDVDFTSPYHDVGYNLCAISSKPFKLENRQHKKNGYYSYVEYSSNDGYTYTHNNETYVYSLFNLNGAAISQAKNWTPYFNIIWDYGIQFSNVGKNWNIWKIITDGIKTGINTSGLGFQDGATIPDLGGIDINADDAVAQALAALKKQFPAIWENALEIPTPPEFYPDTRPVEVPQLVPVPLPQPDPDGITDPITGPSTQKEPNINPDAPHLPKEIDTIFPNPPVDPDPDNPNPPGPDTGKGVTPPIIPPLGAAKAMFTVYNPTEGEVNQFGAWLWTENPLVQLAKMFSNPIEAVISLHKIFITPDTGDKENIYCGYLNSGVSALTVTRQYKTISLGSVSLPEYFGNVFDYSPFTEVSIYLPFVGICQLDTKDILRSTITLEYSVDVYTGALLANVNVKRDGGSGGVLYTFNGNCAVSYPLTSGSWAPLFQNLVSMGVGIGMASATGNPAIAYGMAAHSLVNEQATTYRSGSFSGNSGAMSIKQPYLIISRPQTMLAENFPSYQGKPTNYTTTVGACSGFIKCKVDHIENVPATDSELSEIDTLLQQGILV